MKGWQSCRRSVRSRTSACARKKKSLETALDSANRLKKLEEAYEYEKNLVHDLKVELDHK